jgi:Ohr subfamily peroxiredoxin
MPALYTATATATGEGRDGHAATSDGLLDVDLAIQQELGGAGGKTNPEQLFAAGWAACFHSALKLVARQQKAAIGDSSVTAEVGLVKTEAGGFALEAAEKSEDDQLAKGVQMVHTEFMTLLREAGLEEIPGVGAPFDPEWHEAVAQTKADELTEEPLVVEVLRPGYRFKGRVLRPAAVKVAK